MDLQEEYFIRNNVEHPLIRYNSGGSILLQQSDTLTIGNKWKILNISVINKDGDPGRFEKRIMTPQYNGYKNYGVFFTPDFNKDEDNYFWENCEDKLKNIRSSLRSIGLRAVTDPKIIDIACWEILLYSYDSCVAELPDYFCETFHTVLDDDIPLADRHADLSNSLLLLKNSGISDTQQIKFLLQGWNNIVQLLDSKNKYAYWLAKFIGE